MELSKEFGEIVERRKAVRVFDEHTDVTDAVRRGLSRAVLSPNSSNMQLWEFHQVRDRQTHERITKACLKQSAARTANQLVVVVCRQDKWRERVKWNLAQLKEQFKDKAELTSRDKRALQYYRMLMPLMYRNDPFGFWRAVRTVLRTYLLLKGPSLRMVSHADQRVMLHKSAAIAAQTFMLSMAAEGLDTCPMEGFDEVRIKKALGLPGAAEICMVIGCGKGKAEGVYSQRRRVAESEVIFSR
jgi:nitroreductase